MSVTKSRERDDARFAHLESDPTVLLGCQGLQEGGISAQLEEGLEALAERGHRVSRDRGEDAEGAGRCG